MNGGFAKAPGVSSYAYNPVTSRGNPWKPSLLHRAPWLGLIAFLGALVGILAAAAILYISNNKPVQEWSVQPTVYLAIASAATNILLHFALTQAVTVAWWRRAIRKDTTIADLHRNWDYGQSLWAAITSGRHFSTIALASLLVALVPVNGPLLQQASRVQQGRFEQDAEVRVSIAAEIPGGYTGYLSNRINSPALLTSRFVKVVQEFTQKSPILIADSGCKGSCDARITGAGLAANCSKSESPFSLDTSLPSSQTEEVPQVVLGTDIFGTTLSWSPGRYDPKLDSMDWSVLDWSVLAPGTFSLGVQFKGTEDCVGMLLVRNCTFKPVTVTYPISIGANSEISLAATTDLSDDKFVQGIKLHSMGYISNSFNVSTYGGFFLALADAYESTVHMDYGSIGYQIFNHGALSNRYVNAADELQNLSCSMSFRDPTEDIIADIRELMFRTAIASAEAKDEQRVIAHESLETPVYASSYRFLAIAALVSLLGWFATIPLFLGWWHIGRDVSLSPIETAKAFGAPGLDIDDSNADANAILKEIGNRGARYGVMTTTSPDRMGGYYRERQRLVVGEPERVRSPKAGETYAG
ncbi:MAG: hypothetical protein Q9169_004497 [Polycauliona sp. 2 TL-2023]